METQKKEHKRAVKLLKRRNKLYKRNTYCCIPEAVSSDPKIDDSGNGPKKIKTSPFAEIKKARIEYLKNNYSGKKRRKRKTPWYMLTKGKQYNYEERKQSWGTMTNFFRVLSEQGKACLRTSLSAVQLRELYILSNVHNEVKNWEMEHPEDKTKHEEWINERSIIRREALEKQWKLHHMNVECMNPSKTVFKTLIHNNYKICA